MMISLKVLETMMLLFDATSWVCVGMCGKMVVVCTRIAFHDSRELE